MSHKTVEVKIDEEVYALVKKASEAGRHGKPCTIPEMASDLVTTGIYRRIAANKWAKAHAAPKVKRAKKVKAPKEKKAAAPKAAKKAPVAPKVKRAPKVKAPEPTAVPPPVQEPVTPAPASLLE